MTFWVNQKVICVNASPQPEGSWCDEVCALELQHVYTVFRSNYINEDGSEVIQLVEAKNPFGYFVSRFRPVVEPKTEISFTTGADPLSGQFDNRRKVRKKVTT